MVWRCVGSLRVIYKHDYIALARKKANGIDGGGGGGAGDDDDNSSIRKDASYASVKMIKTCNMIAIACRLHGNKHTRKKNNSKRNEKKTMKNNKKEYSNFPLRITLFNITFGA